jgi:hypothetical protein
LTARPRRCPPGSQCRVPRTRQHTRRPRVR